MAPTNVSNLIQTLPYLPTTPIYIGPLTITMHPAVFRVTLLAYIDGASTGPCPVTPPVKFYTTLGKKSPVQRIHLDVINLNDLGITISSDMSWASHIEFGVPKANKTLGLVKRVCCNMTNPSTLKLLYCALVIPKLEYGSCLWSTFKIKHCSLIENVQRREIKFILNYPKKVLYKTILTDTGLLSI